MGTQGLKCYPNEFTKEFPELNVDDVSEVEPEDEDEVTGGLRLSAAAPVAAPAAEVGGLRGGGCSGGYCGCGTA